MVGERVMVERVEGERVRERVRVRESIFFGFKTVERCRRGERLVGERVMVERVEGERVRERVRERDVPKSFRFYL